MRTPTAIRTTDTLPTHILAAFSSAEPSARIIITIIGDDDPVTPEPGGPV
jgi:hypothetical protein